MPVKLASCKIQSYESTSEVMQARVPVRVLKAIGAEPGDEVNWFTDGDDVYCRVVRNG